MTLKKLLCGLSLGAGLLVWAGPAVAQDTFAAQGTFAVSAERITGYTWTKTKFEANDGPIDYEAERTRTQFDFLAKGEVNDPFSAPRIGFDYFPIDGLSIGGFFGYASSHLEGEETNNNITNDLAEEDGSGFLFGARVGYVYMFTPVVGIWPRGGITYSTSKDEIDPAGAAPSTEVETNLFALGLEAMLVISPVPHAGFIIGPTLDFPITGGGHIDNGTTVDTDIDDLRVTTIGIQAGVMAYF